MNERELTNENALVTLLPMKFMGCCVSKCYVEVTRVNNSYRGSRCGQSDRGCNTANLFEYYFIFCCTLGEQPLYNTKHCDRSF